MGTSGDVSERPKKNSGVVSGEPGLVHQGSRWQLPTATVWCWSRRMKMLLFGKNGQLGWELQRSLSLLGTVVALNRHGIQGVCGDLADITGLRRTIRQIRPDVVINAAAYTQVDRAEQEPELASLINAKAPSVIAEEVEALGGLLVHYSTDYVFNGSGRRPWKENDPTEPLSQYGVSKRDGEIGIQESNCRYVILRTSWVYSALGNNFIKTMLRLAKERKTLNVINDQIGAPTGADLLADATAHILIAMQKREDLCGGIYHLAANGETSWYGYARHIFEQLKIQGMEFQLKELNPIPAMDYPLPAKRPYNSRLNIDKVEKEFGLCMPRWQDGVSRMLKEWVEKNNV